MIKEALEYIHDSAALKFAPTTIETGDIATKTVVINGEIKTVPLAAKPRKHQLSSLDDLIAAVKDIGQDEDLSAVFFDEDAVTSVLDYRHYRVSTVSFALKKSDAWRTICSRPASMDQKAFIRLLRIDLAGCLPPVALLEIVRRVKFENGTTVKAEVGRQKESLGREIRSQVDTEREIPEEVTLEIPVYKSMGEREKYCLACSVEVDPMQGTFKLAPLPDEIERVQHLAMTSIRDRLVDGLPDIPVFYGSP